MKRMVTMLMVVAVAATGLWAAPPKPEPAVNGKGQVILSWDEFVKITGFDPLKQKVQGRQVIKVPWADIEKLLGVKVENVGKVTTVDLPWQEFKALLEYSVRKDKPKDDPPVPTDYIVASSSYEGTLSAEGAEFVLTLKLNVLKKKGWKRIPLLPATVALKDSTLPAETYLNVSGKSYELLTEKSGPLEVKLTFASAVTKTAGTNRVQFDRPTPGSSVLKLTVDGDKVDVKVAGAQSLSPAAQEGKTVVAAAIPAGTAVSITWERAIPKAPAAPTKLYAETLTLASVADGLLLCQETVNFNILHTAVRELKLTAPKGASVLTVTGTNLQDWRVGDDGKIAVTLGAETIGSYSLRITYEQAAGEKGEVPVPVIRAEGVEREKGFIAVVALANVEIGAGKVAGATAIDARRLPGTLTAMTNQPILLGFRYVGKTFAIPLTISKHGEVPVLVTVGDSALFTGMQLNDGRRMTKAVYSIRNNRSQFLRLKMPTGAEIWSVSVAGNTVTPGKDAEGNVLIPLVRSRARSSELTAFPVTFVYVETPEGDKAPQASGTLRVELPVCPRDVPVMHAMYNLYLPAEGVYTRGWSKDPSISGPMQVVEGFASLSTSAGAVVVAAKPAAQAAAMQKQFDRRADARLRATGVTPIRVRLPIKGKLFRLQKILALPGDKLYFQVEYRGWKVAK
ncbi:MAG: hypothetical protein ISS78_07415 [Phycisphaerae bacterium]|nr:hypothetical protein [Phycisphaerae bacterium]